MASSLPEKVLAATDGSEDAALAARAATELVCKSRVELRVYTPGTTDLYLTPTAI